ncbi:N-acetylglutamate kinase [Deinococcus radiodurans R1 = ATCC 13939 = DSM 20539]|uniref:[LysW]-aminoadipate kinase n=2 Tax=Deinococcus radiodurans TaxID=1299 RepID=LYSZ_DEIRA|nr:RecName: Full=[LysW]-aminoadipate kinase [Deinococcus radiodurans R1 = ATCC 13939 = DSM 20539]AAF10984.1 N-acetylglutamate kinase [Deinococcus radiodurans R1 = ATCC 13939 = DSM 20539]
MLSRDQHCFTFAKRFSFLVCIRIVNMIVVKVGGSDGIDYDAVCADLAERWQAGEKLILVHGGSGETNRVAEALGHPPKFVTSPSGYTSRFTDRQTLEIFEMVYCGKMNKGLVERLQRLGVNAVGLSGLDGRIFEGKHKDSVRSVENGKVKVLRGDHTGTVEKVNTGLIELLLGAGYLPVLTPPAASYEGVAINVDGDRAAAQLAAALRAEALLLLSNVPGLLRDYPDEASLIREIPANDVESYLEFAQDRMKKKVLGAAEAVAGGVGRVVFGDARAGKPISAALAGEGTVVS